MGPRWVHVGSTFGPPLRALRAKTYGNGRDFLPVSLEQQHRATTLLQLPNTQPAGPTGCKRTPATGCPRTPATGAHARAPGAKSWQPPEVFPGGFPPPNRMQTHARNRMPTHARNPRTPQQVPTHARNRRPLAKAGSTLRSSRAVPHPSTNRALRRLTSEVGRDPVHSTRYGRQRLGATARFDWLSARRQN